MNNKRQRRLAAEKELDDAQKAEQNSTSGGIQQVAIDFLASLEFPGLTEDGQMQAASEVYLRNARTLIGNCTGLGTCCRSARTAERTNVNLVIAGTAHVFMHIYRRNYMKSLADDKKNAFLYTENGKLKKQIKDLEDTLTALMPSPDAPAAGSAAGSAAACVAR